MVRVVTIYRSIDTIKKPSGKRYTYYRPVRGGPRVAMETNPGEPGFEDEYARISAGARGPIPGTLAYLVAQYKASAWWLDLAPATKISYSRAFDCLAPLGRDDPNAFTRSKLLQFRDTILLPARGRWLANYTITVLSVLFKFGADSGLVESNVLAERVRSIRKPKDAAEQNRAWSAQERRAVLAEAPPHIRLPVAMILCTGLRIHDVLSETMAALRGDEIRVKTRKRGVHVALPVHPILADAIAARGAVDALTICVNLNGKPWTQTGFNSTWQRFRNRLEAAGKIAPGLTLHGGRHTFIGLLDEMAVPQDVRMKLAGHQSPAQNAEYSKHAPIPEHTRGIIRKLKI